MTYLSQTIEAIPLGPGEVREQLLELDRALGGLKIRYNISPEIRCCGKTAPSIPSVHYLHTNIAIEGPGGIQRGFGAKGFTTEEVCRELLFEIAGCFRRTGGKLVVNADYDDRREYSIVLSNGNMIVQPIPFVPREIHTIRLSGCHRCCAM